MVNFTSHGIVSSDDMAEVSNRRATQPAEAEPSIVLGQPRERLVVEENAPPEDDITYPTGLKLWLTVGSLGICMILKGLVRTYSDSCRLRLTQTFRIC